MVEWFDKLPEREAKRILGSKGYTAYKAINSAYNKSKSNDEYQHKSTHPATVIKRDFKTYEEPSKPYFRQIDKQARKIPI